ncbi:MAG TPA: tRNA isopentenyl-2-thiomethyl-A-37 hydroxylase MiaE [Polyangiaceae bacterium]|jgi:tRNA-(ms[2]io[6]A)-hydroxylase
MLGLLAPTDARWADAAVADLDAVLRDHAHCEMKAASHAMSLAARHPDDLALVRKLVAIAQEELAHFDRVLAILASRGLALGTPPVDEYAATLRGRVAKLPRAEGALVDRLLVCALIEARSCERFKLLVERLGEGHELFAFYKELFAAEARHFREFLELAIQASSEGVAHTRLQSIASIEAEIVRERARATDRASIHG